MIKLHFHSRYAFYVFISSEIIHSLKIVISLGVDYITFSPQKSRFNRTNWSSSRICQRKNPWFSKLFFKIPLLHFELIWIEFSTFKRLYWYGYSKETKLRNSQLSGDGLIWFYFYVSYLKNFLFCKMEIFLKTLAIQKLAWFLVYLSLFANHKVRWKSILCEPFLWRAIHRKRVSNTLVHSLKRK